MTDFALDTRLDTASAAPSEPFLTRRVHALFRLIGLRNRKAGLAATLDFADARMQADVGVEPRKHRHDWLEAFLAR